MCVDFNNMKFLTWVSGTKIFEEKATHPKYSYILTFHCLAPIYILTYPETILKTTLW